MSVLKIGKMTTSELAEWFNMTSKSYTNNRQKKLAELEYFCEFETVYGGVIVKDIYLDTYIKNAVKDVDFVIKEIIKGIKNPDYDCAYIGTNTIMASRLVKKLNYSITIDTAKDRVGHACKFIFNKKYKKNVLIQGAIYDEPGGVFGWRKNILLIKENDTVRFFTEEEYQELKDMAAKLYAKQAEEMLKLQQTIDSYTDSDLYCDMSEQEFKTHLKKKNNSFYTLMKQYKEIHGLQFVNGTVYIFNDAGQKKIKVVLAEIGTEPAS